MGGQLVGRGLARGEEVAGGGEEGRRYETELTKQEVIARRKGLGQWQEVGGRGSTWLGVRAVARKIYTAFRGKV